MDSYQFSPIHQATAVAFSPGSTFIASADGDHVQIRSTTTLGIAKTWVCAAPQPVASSSRFPEALVVDKLQWSSNGSRILASSTKSACAWVFDLAQEDQRAGLSGDVTRAEWGTDNDILAWSERGLAIHDLSTGESRFIQSVQGGHSWSPDRRYFAIAERHHGKDYLGIYDHKALIRHFPLQTVETSGVSWSPCGKWIAVWDWHLNYAIHFYSPVGAQLGSYTMPTASATMAELGTSIRSVAWAPAGRHIAIGNSDGSVRVLESENWLPIAHLRGYETTTWREPVVSQGPREQITQFILGASSPVKGPVSQMGFSTDGMNLFFAQESALHVYTFLPEATSAVPDIEHSATIMFNEVVRAARYCPTASRIAAVTRTRRVYVWDGLGVEGVDIPDGKLAHTLGADRLDVTFTAIDVHWAPDGRAAVLCDRSSFCLVYEDLQEISGDVWEEEQ